MHESGVLQILFYLIVLILLVKPMGLYIASVYEKKPCFMDRIVKPVEHWVYRLCGILPEKEMHWKEYAASMLIFSLLGIGAVYAFQRLQAFLPLNPEHFANVGSDLAFNTAASFVTNTNWQAYGGESTLSYLTQMCALTVQNFLSAATGLSLLMAFIRGLQRQETSGLGNFWTDTVRGILYIFLPLSIILTLLLVSQGVIQNVKPYQTVKLIQETKMITEQIIPMGPVASQVAIKQLGTNGGGFFNTNSAHPFENPSPFSNFLEMLAILLIPAALCYTFGVRVKDTRQGWALFLAMFLMMLPLLLGIVSIEQKGNLKLAHLGAMGPNMEGKELRFGVANAGLWAAVTTASGNGSTNAALDSFLPLGGLIPLWLIDLAEVIFGGVGSGLYQMLLFVIISVFIAGLMVGRTPEYLGKKIESYEMKMASLALLIMPLTVLSCTALALVLEAGKSSIGNPGTHGFTEVLYAFSSMTNNNGSAFGGLHANTLFYNTLGGMAILVGRYWIAIPVLAIAGSLAKKKTVPVSSGTLPTDNVLFVFLLIGVVLIFGALTFFPAFCLGPIVEHLMINEY